MSDQSTPVNLVGIGPSVRLVVDESLCIVLEVEAECPDCRCSVDSRHTISDAEGVAGSILRARETASEMWDAAEEERLRHVAVVAAQQHQEYLSRRRNARQAADPSRDRLR